MCPATTFPPEDQPMRAVILLSTVCLTGFAATAVAQQPTAQPKPKPAAPAAQPTATTAKSVVAGTWPDPDSRGRDGRRQRRHRGRTVRERRAAGTDSHHS